MDEILGNNQGIVEVISDVLNTNVGMKAPFLRPADEQDKLFNPACDHLYVRILVSTVMRDS
jgi:hypothetical protein